MDNIEIELVKTEQSIYEGFNRFIISDDTKVFGKLLARATLMQEVKDIPGDIVECGVFKGSGIFTFLKLKRYLCPNSYKKVIGFDIFNSQELINSLHDIDKSTMHELFKSRDFDHKPEYKEFLELKLKECGFQQHEFLLIMGDVSKTTPKFIDENPGFKISLLYLDLDLEEPTYDVLCAFWDRVSLNGIVVFDEYAYSKWSESKGVDRFFQDKQVQIESLNYICPTAIIRKKNV